jgi:hypothetical protein
MLVEWNPTPEYELHYLNTELKHWDQKKVMSIDKSHVCHSLYHTTEFDQAIAKMIRRRNDLRDKIMVDTQGPKTRRRVGGVKA